MKLWQKLLNRIIQLEEKVFSFGSRLNKLEADMEYVSMMTDVDIIIEEDNENAQ